MPTPLLPPPTPLLSALPVPPLPYAPLLSPISAQWSRPLSPLLSSSAPAELPSFQLESAAVANHHTPYLNALCLTGAVSASKGVSLLSPTNSNHAQNAQSSIGNAVVDGTASASHHTDDGVPSLLADALKRVQQQQHQHSDPSPPPGSVDAPVIQARGVKGAEAYNAVVSLKPPSLSHSHSFSVGESATEAIVTISSTAANGPSTASSGANHQQQTQYSQSTPASVSPSITVSPSSSRASSTIPSPSNRQKAQQADQRSMARLSSIRSLLDHASPSTYIILDLDETVYCQFHAPCSMMTEKGLQRYQCIITSHPAYKHLTFSNKSSLTRALQAAVSRKRGVERETISTIRQLQSKGVPVFALTARFSSMMATTKMELASLGLDLSLTSPFKHFVRDSATNAVISDGIIFTNAHEKGPILNRFLTTVFDSHLNGTPTVQLQPAPSSPPLPSSKPISIPIPTTGTSASNMYYDARTLSTSVPSSSAAIVFKTSKKLRPKKLRAQFYADEEEDIQIQQTPKPRNGQISAAVLDAKRLNDDSMSNLIGVVSLPTKIIFVDDRLQNCVSVMNGLRVAQTLNIALLTFHYTPNTQTTAQPGSDREDSDVHSPVDPVDTLLQEDDDDDDDDDRLLQLAEYQIHHFIRCQQILRDKDAKQHKQGNNGVKIGAHHSDDIAIDDTLRVSTQAINISDPHISNLSVSLNVFKQQHQLQSNHPAHSHHPTPTQMFQHESQAAAATLVTASNQVR